MMKNTLIFLGTLAIVLGIFTYFTVFGNPSGTYGIKPTPVVANSATSTTFIMPTSTAASSTNQSSTGGVNFYGTAFPSSPFTWSDGGAQFSITSAALQGSQLTFTLTIKIGGSPTCVPLNLRLVADETGNLQGPDTPSFSFPDTASCNGAANAQYTNQSVTFTVDPANFPLLFTTNNGNDTFFEAATTTANGIVINIPSNSG